MITTNLFERRQRLEQRKNRLKQQEASIHTRERRERTRRLIELGGLVLKAHLQDWDSNTLLGAFLSLKEREPDQKQIESWAHKGGTAFSVEKVQKTAVIVKFEEPPAEDIRISLKSLGLKWNALRKEWEGYTQIKELKELLEPHQASVQEVNLE